MLFKLLFSVNFLIWPGGWRHQRRAAWHCQCHCHWQGECRGSLPGAGLSNQADAARDAAAPPPAISESVTSGTLPYHISGFYTISGHPLTRLGYRLCVPISESGFSFDPILGHVACDPISGSYIGYTPDIGSSCHRYRKPHTWYRDQYWVQYRVSRYRWHDIPISVSISGTNIRCTDIRVGVL